MNEGERLEVYKDVDFHIQKQTLFDKEVAVLMNDIHELDVTIETQNNKIDTLNEECSSLRSKMDRMKSHILEMKTHWVPPEDWTPTQEWR